jgi:DNA replication protein DnaC
MSYTSITERMRSLKLQGMVAALENVLTSKQASHLNAEQMLELLLQQEYDDRKSRKIDRLRNQAKFRYNASLEQITPSAKRNLDANQIAGLSTCTWIEKAENLLITGPTGAGKSHLASAFGNQACLNGHRVLYFNSQKLFYNLRLSRMDGTHRKFIHQLSKSDLLIIDDFGLQRMDEQQRLDMMEIIEDRHGIKSTLIASQLPVSAWYEIIGEPTLSDAILDRITSGANRIELKGESMRKNK